VFLEIVSSLPFDRIPLLRLFQHRCIRTFQNRLSSSKTHHLALSTRHFFSSGVSLLTMSRTTVRQYFSLLFLSLCAAAFIARAEEPTRESIIKDLHEERDGKRVRAL